ncbi:ribosome assembly RNA-binding protein YhbY [Cysteiniphilum halobium]|uniref:ribosome assembly RNA-binding protein YhbY n=1 Tax=Cysteiniphilum halobium TaxID=2219059 RepID=UPI000E6502F8|nr:ribosome assembly RNA-binding protein YhbY [Cysteiniphilum halobium]
MALTSQQRQQLKAQAHSLNPVVLLGEKGLTNNVLTEIDLALTAHELIKVKIAGTEKDVRQATTEEICEKTKCELVQLIGNISVLYRKKPKKKGA